MLGLRAFGEQAKMGGASTANPRRWILRGRRVWGAAAAIGGVVTLAGCGGDSATEPEPPRAAAISVSPESVELMAVGETARFTAGITDQFGATFQGTVSWSSGAPDVFTVDANGVVTAVANGSGTVQASFQTLSATAHPWPLTPASRRWRASRSPR